MYSVEFNWNKNELITGMREYSDDERSALATFFHNDWLHASRELREASIADWVFKLDFILNHVLFREVVLSDEWLAAISAAEFISGNFGNKALHIKQILARHLNRISHNDAAGSSFVGFMKGAQRKYYESDEEHTNALSRVREIVISKDPKITVVLQNIERITKKLGISLSSLDSA
jgi:hypothetical protein